MKLRAIVAASLLPLCAEATRARADTLTLAEAKRLSPHQLAARLLGAAGEAGDFREAQVSGDGGLMIHAPGLNSVDFYRQPKSTGFDQLCQVEGVSVQFTTSRYNTPGDPPHRVSDFWKFVRFAVLSGGAKDRACARLGPVVPSRSTGPAAARPTFFAVVGDKPVDASFALRAVTKATAAAVRVGNQLTCTAHDRDWPICTNPEQALRGLAVDRFHYAKVERCSDTNSWCVSATWFISRTGNETREIELLIHTNARQVDPPTEFDVTTIAIDAGTSIDD